MKMKTEGRDLSKNSDYEDKWLCQALSNSQGGERCDDDIMQQDSVGWGSV